MAYRPSWKFIGFIFSFSLRIWYSKLILNKSWKQHPTKQPLSSYPKKHLSKTNKTCGTQLEKQGWTHKKCSSMDPDTWIYQQELIYICSVLTLDVIWRIWPEQWMIRTDGEKERVREICVISMNWWSSFTKFKPSQLVGSHCRVDETPFLQFSFQIK